MKSYRDLKYWWRRFIGKKNWTYTIGGKLTTLPPCEYYVAKYIAKNYPGADPTIFYIDKENKIKVKEELWVNTQLQ